MLLYRSLLWMWVQQVYIYGAGHGTLPGRKSVFPNRAEVEQNVHSRSTLEQSLSHDPQETG